MTPSTSATSPAALRAGRRRAVLAASITAFVCLALDLWSKSWAWNTLRDRPRIAVIKQWFYFDFSFNTGSAFGFLRDYGFSRPLFILITLATVGYMVQLVRTLPTARLYGFVAIGAIIGGALGNLHDRLVRQIEIAGELKYGVVDFIQIFYHQLKPSWPNFNIADVALVVGVILLVPFLLLHADPPEPAEPTPTA